MRQLDNPLSLADFAAVKANLGKVAEEDIAWTESLGPPTDPDRFAEEAIYVICNSGMKNTVARKIYGNVCHAIRHGMPVRVAFGHKGKADAIDEIWRKRQSLLDGFLRADDKLAFCASLPWIGEITKYHLAKNFGVDVAKPDVHLQRLADREGVTPQQLCERLAAATGYRAATIDTVLWRACATGIINSRTAELNEARP